LLRARRSLERMSPWWVLVSAVLVAGTVAVLWAVSRTLDTARDLLDPERGLGAAAAPVTGLSVDAGLARDRLGDVTEVVRRRRNLLSVARPGRPWRQLWARLRGTERHVPGGSSP